MTRSFFLGALILGILFGIGVCHLGTVLSQPAAAQVIVEEGEGPIRYEYRVIRFDGLDIADFQKTLNALGQAALLHLGAGGPTPEAMQRMLALVQTSSPSYLLMASLDWARYTAARDAAWTAARALWALRGLPDVAGEFTERLDTAVGFAGRMLLTPLPH